jgi:hypothetical protein
MIGARGRFFLGRVMWGSMITLSLFATGCRKSTKTKNEIVRRQEFARAIMLDAGAGSALAVGSSNELHFEEGFSTVQLDPPEDFRNHAFRYMAQKGRVRIHAHGDKPMHLKVGGWVNEKVLKTKPRVSVTIAGQAVGGTSVLDDTGVFKVDTVVPGAVLHEREWVDLEIDLSAVAFHWGEPPDLKVALIFELAWYE